MEHSDFHLTVWHEEDYRKLICHLHALADPSYKEFHQKLIPGVDNLLGIRVPILRALAKEIAKGELHSYFRLVTKESYEEVMLYGMVIGQIKKDLDLVFEQLARFIPMIDNWAVCDVCCSSLKIATKNQEEMLDFLKPYLMAKEEFALRFGLVMLMDHYIDDRYLSMVLETYANIHHSGYYVKMAVAWGLSVCFVKYREQTLGFLRQGCLDEETYQKTLQKIMESNRVSKQDKEMIRGMKSSTSKK